MFFRKKNKPRERFYLLPGQGGRNFHIKQKRIMRWTIAVSLALGVVMAGVMWWQAHPHR